jgi:hypothetical protein
LKALGRIDDVARLGNSRGLACRRPGRTRSAEKEALQLGQQVHDEGKVVSAFLDSLESNPDHRVFVVRHVMVLRCSIDSTISVGIVIHLSQEGDSEK